MMPLSRSWLRFIFKNYAWSRLPLRSEIFLLSGFLAFVDSFLSLEGVIVPFFPGNLLTSSRLALLETASSVGLS